jgi:hypothetical protein
LKRGLRVFWRHGSERNRLAIFNVQTVETNLKMGISLSLMGIYFVLTAKRYGSLIGRKEVRLNETFNRGSILFLSTMDDHFDFTVTPG